MIQMAIPTLLLMLGTLASEDLTCITAGQLIGRAEMHWSVGVFGCFAGIYVGDLGLWLMGRILGRGLMRIPWMSRRFGGWTLEQLGRWFDRNAPRAIVAARFLPGTRLPLYVAAGMLGRNAGRFAFWTFVAAAAWTPAIVLLVAWAGERFTHLFERFLGGRWIALVVGVLVCFTLLRTITLLLTEIGRARLMARISRLWRWEFWPMMVFYPPVGLWVAWLSLRHRGFTTITAANPGIPHGGFVGESKFDILRQLDSPHVIPGERINPGELDKRVAQLGLWMEEESIDYPIILKPDSGQRGAGVKLICSREAASRCLEQTPDSPMLAQPFHPGPHEAGIFYYRIPGEPRGRIFSITDKHFSYLIGDGLSTIRQLIWRHPRYRMQADTFLERHADQLDRVLKNGETFPLAIAGNHCQGTLFRDGAHLITPQLEAKIDQIARTFDGFHFGRFDVRYADVEALKRGEDLTIIELNGITSESTNIYDPSRSLLWAYRMLFRQWSILFRIGAANRSRGHRTSGIVELLRDVVTYYRSPRVSGISD